MRRFALYLIQVYQSTLSPDHGWSKHHHPAGYCRFTPTCSQYTYQAVEKYGVIKGSWLGVKRIIRCNPRSAGGYDPIP